MPRALASSTSRARDQQRRQRVAGRRGGAEVAADRAAVADLRRADRARRLGERRQQRRERRLHRLGVGQPGAEPERAVLARPAASSSTSFRSSSASGRRRSKFSSTIRSVPPWIGTASGRSALSRSASSRRARRQDVHRARNTAVRFAPWQTSRRRLAVARGDEPADLVVRGGRVLSVFTREWLETDVAIVDGFVAGLGDYEGAETLDATGSYVVPGLHRRAHAPRVVEAARRTSSRGSCSRSGRRRSSRTRTRSRTCSARTACTGCSTSCGDLPLDVFFMASSSVPASKFESPRRALSAGDLEALLRRRRVLGLAEMMNFPGVVARRRARAREARARGATHVDGHAPGVHGKELNAYAAAGHPLRPRGVRRSRRAASGCAPGCGC